MAVYEKIPFYPFVACCCYILLGTGKPHKKSACQKPGDSVTSLSRGMAAQACHKPSLIDSQAYVSALSLQVRVPWTRREPEIISKPPHEETCQIREKARLCHGTGQNLVRPCLGFDVDLGEGRETTMH